MIMKENMISIGLDIGTTKIVAMIGQTNEYNKMKILGVGKSISLGEELLIILPKQSNQFNKLFLKQKNFLGSRSKELL